VHVCLACSVELCAVLWLSVFAELSYFGINMNCFERERERRKLSLEFSYFRLSISASASSLVGYLTKK